ncbi:glucuronate isomerase [Sporosarcina sp. E16_8]|nr:glucuronate isomerase [Sporosarcina sp. E16_8]
MHLSAFRDNNTRMPRLLGPDTGFDSIGNLIIANKGRKLSTNEYGVTRKI